VLHFRGLFIISFVCTESLTLVSDPTSRRFIRWLLFQTFIYISQLIRHSRVCGSYQNFLDRWLLLTRKLGNHGLILVKLKSSVRKFYGRHHDFSGGPGFTLVYSGVRVTWYLAFGYCIVSPSSIYGFCFSFRIFKLFLSIPS